VPLPWVSFVSRTVARATSTVAPVFLSVVGALVFGGSAGSGSALFGGWLPEAMLNLVVVVTSLLALIMFPVIFLEMWWCRDESGSTWYERYKNTPGIINSQVVICSCFWSFAPRSVGILCNHFCHSFEPPLRVWDTHKHMVTYRLIYFVHVFPSIVISVLGPFQLIGKIRKCQTFTLHRWLGRALLAGSTVHQAAAT